MPTRQADDLLAFDFIFDVMAPLNYILILGSIKTLYSMVLFDLPLCE